MERVQERAGRSGDSWDSVWGRKLWEKMMGGRCPLFPCQHSSDCPRSSRHHTSLCYSSHIDLGILYPSETYSRARFLRQLSCQSVQASEGSISYQHHNIPSMDPS